VRFAGVVVAANEELERTPSLLNQDAFGHDWMLIVRTANPNWRDVTGQASAKPSPPGSRRKPTWGVGDRDLLGQPLVPAFGMGSLVLPPPTWSNSSPASGLVSMAEVPKTDGIAAAQ
jgi:glycine cleavage system H protein